MERFGERFLTNLPWQPITSKGEGISVVGVVSSHPKPFKGLMDKIKANYKNATSPNYIKATHLEASMEICKNFLIYSREISTKGTIL